MQNLSIQLIINAQCQLVAIDETNYTELISTDADGLVDMHEHVSLEFLVYRDETAPIEDTIVFKRYWETIQENDKHITTINFTQDGIHTYYKFLIPRLEHLIKKDEEQLSYNSIDILDQVFYWDNKFYFGKKSIDVSGNDIDTIIQENLSLILSDEYSTVITNYLDIWEYIQQNKASQTFSYQKNIFSVCKLQNCLVNLQRKFLENPKIDLCDEDVFLRQRRDFLLSALYVFDYLKDRNNYDEAQRLLDNLVTCVNICDSDSNFNTDCGCGSIKY